MTGLYITIVLLNSLYNFKKIKTSIRLYSIYIGKMNITGSSGSINRVTL